jgi:hypothetical protein
MSRAVDLLIDALDALDAVDEDLELNGDELEPELGSPEMQRGAWRADGTTVYTDGCEAVDEDGGDICDGPHDAEGATGIADWDGLDEQTARSARVALEARQRSIAGLSDQYTSRVDGVCCEPVYWHRDVVLIDKKALCRSGDFVAIHLHPEFRWPTGHTAMIKRLVLDARNGPASIESIGRGVIVEMLNPPERITLPAWAVLAMHRCTGRLQTLVEAP